MPNDLERYTRFRPLEAAGATTSLNRIADGGPIITIDPGVKKAILARRAILEKWRQLGGAASPVGLPLDTAFPVVALQNGSQVNFRGGALRTMDHTPGFVEVLPRRVIVTFEGYGLEIRQEDGDELYGTLSCKVGSTGYTQSFDLLQVELGPDDGNRVYQAPIVLWDGPPVDLNIMAAIVEHDDGDRDAIRRTIRERIGDVFRLGAAAVTGGGLTGAETSTAQFGYAAESSSTNALVEWALGGAATLVTDLLGLGDDAYNPAALTITAAEMMHAPPTQTYTCYSDPRTIQFTHSRTITGSDDGGDVGQVTLLFRVRSVT